MTRKSKREIERQVESLADATGKDRDIPEIVVRDTVIGTEWGGDSSDAGDVVDEDTMVISP